MEYLLQYLINYFSNGKHVFFWGCVIFFALYEKIKKSNKLKMWLKKHNIGKKY